MFSRNSFALYFLIFFYVSLIFGQKNTASLEKKILLKNSVVAIWTIPQKKNKTKIPAVLLLHGFASSKDEVGGMYKRLAQALAQKKIASLRIDFSGWGESRFPMEDCTIDSQLKDVDLAYQYLQSNKLVDKKRIGILGFSLGGGVAIVSAGQNPHRYRSLALWSSVGNFQESFFAYYLQGGFEKKAQKEIVTINLGWKKIRLRKSFFESLKRYDILNELKKYPSSLLTIGGENDPLAKYVRIFLDTCPSLKKKGVIIDKANHIYGVLGKDQSKAQAVIKETTAWFESMLK